MHSSFLSGMGIEEIEMTFSIDCKIGMSVDGFEVTDVQEGGQANYFGVQVGWTIIATNGILSGDNVNRLSTYLDRVETWTFYKLTLRFAKTNPGASLLRNSESEGSLQYVADESVLMSEETP